MESMLDRTRRLASKMGLSFDELISSWSAASGKTRNDIEDFIKRGVGEDYIFIPHLGPVTAPNQDLGYARINEEGFRGDSIKPKAQGTFRVVLLGGSVAWGRGSTSEETTPAKQLVDVLRQKAPDRNWELINLGMPGFISMQELFLYSQRAKELDADLVLVLSCANDVYYGWRLGMANAHPAMVFESRGKAEKRSGIKSWAAKLFGRGEREIVPLELPRYTYTVW